MNLSPTPRRYTSRSKGTMNPDNAYVYSDPIGQDYNNGGLGMPNGINSDRIIPEEYRLNSQMINRLIKQNKELVAKLDSKQEEIDRLNILVGSLRGKLIKYTEMNKKLEDNLIQTGSRVSSTMTENEQDYIQVPKRRTDFNANKKENTAPGNMVNDDRVNALADKIDKLTKLVLQNNVPLTSSPLQSPVVPSSSSTAKRTLISPSEEDIMCRESTELKQMEDQIDSLKRKLLIKRENELRKISLNQELLELMDKLNMQHPTERDRERLFTISSGSTHNGDTSPEYCTECHQQELKDQKHHHHHFHSMRNLQSNSMKNSEFPASNPLETPTPLPKNSGTNKSQNNDLTDTINRVW